MKYYCTYLLFLSRHSEQRRESFVSQCVCAILYIFSRQTFFRKIPYYNIVIVYYSGTRTKTNADCNNFKTSFSMKTISKNPIISFFFPLSNITTIRHCLTFEMRTQHAAICGFDYLFLLYLLASRDN